MGLVGATDSYAALAPRPDPDAADSALTLLAWGGTASAVALAFALTRLNAESWGIVPLAGLGIAGLILSVPAGYGAAAVLHALSMLSGGQHGFSRSLLAAAALGPLPALVLAALWAPDAAWLAAPLLYGTWLTVSAVEKLHDAPGGQVWMVVGFAGALLAGSAVLGREKVTLALVRLENSATVLSNNPNAAREERASGVRLSQPLAAPAATGGAAAQGDRLTGQSGAAGPLEADPAAAAAAPGRSSLDYLRTDAQPPDEGGPSPAAVEQDQRLVQAQQMQNTAAGLLGNLSAMLEKNASSMPPEQAAQLKKTLAQFEASMKGGKGAPQMTKEDAQRVMAQVMSLMAAQKGGAAQPAPSKPAKGAARRGAPPPPSGD